MMMLSSATEAQEFAVVCTVLVSNFHSLNARGQDVLQTHLVGKPDPVEILAVLVVTVAVIL